MKKEKKQVDTNKVYKLTEATEMLKDLSTSKFAGSVDLDIVLNLKDKNKKDIIRGTLTLPNSLGEEKKVIVLAEEKFEKEALAAGATKAGSASLVEELLKGFSDFDVVIATPALMPQIAKLGKVLGPKGLMPNPKNGTITTDVAKAVASFRSGKINYKSAPEQPVIRLKIAKVDMAPKAIAENALTVLKSVQQEVKKLSSNPFKKIVISPTMGAGLKLDISDIISSLV